MSMRGGEVRRRRRSQSIGDVVDAVLDAVVHALVRVVVTLAGTIGWCLLVVVSVWSDVVWLSSVVCLVVMFAGFAVMRLSSDPAVRVMGWYVMPVIGDVVRFRRRLARTAGNQFVRDCGLVRESGRGRSRLPLYRVYLTRPHGDRVGRLEIVDMPVAGMTMDALRAHIGESLALVGAADYEVMQPDRRRWPCRYTVEFYSQDRVAVLQAPRVLEALPPVRVGRGQLTVRIGRGVAGDRWLDFSGVSGVTLAGIPGAGKTAAADVLVAALLAHPDVVDLFIADGKGGADWGWAAEFLPDGRYTNDDSYEVILPMLRAVQALMRRRLQTNASRYGDSNFWHWGPTSDDHAVVVVLDEIQTWTSPVGSSKDVKASREEFIALATDIVKKGRSAGICLLALTQKPTADAIPTGLRDNAALRVAFRVTTREAAQAALGVIPEGDPSPTDICFEDKGMSVMTTVSGDTEFVRWDYISETSMTRLLAAARSGAQGPGRVTA